MTDYNDGEWHIWKGGECPVHPLSTVEVRLRAGCNASFWSAQSFVWRHDGHDDDIICFRVVKAHREPRVWWVNEYSPTELTMHSSKENADGFALPARRRCIKVQEVIE